MNKTLLDINVFNYLRNVIPLSKFILNTDIDVDAKVLHEVLSPAREEYLSLSQEIETSDNKRFLIEKLETLIDNTVIKILEL